jgi:hypothetical protein
MVHPDGEAMMRKRVPQAAADASYARMITGPTSFWTAVHAPFIRHDLTRADVREVVRRGLERTGGSYRLLAELFNLIPTDYERFLTFLHEYDCDVCSLPFSSISDTIQRRSTQLSLPPIMGDGVSAD